MSKNIKINYAYLFKIWSKDRDLYFEYGKLSNYLSFIEAYFCELNNNKRRRYSVK